VSSSKSSQSNAQTYTDNRAVLGEGALYANNGASISNYVLDGGAVAGALNTVNSVFNRAMSGSSQTGAQAFNFGSDALGFGSDVVGKFGQVTGQAFNFGSDALGTVDSLTRNTTGQAFNFGSDALGTVDSLTRNTTSQAFNFGSDALAFGGDVVGKFGQATTQALNFGSDALAFGGDVVGKFGQAATQALNFGSDALGTVDSLTRNTTSQAFNFGSDALASATDQVNKATSQALNFGSDALGFGDRAFDLIGDGLGRVLDTTADTQQLVANAYNDAKGRGAMTDKILIATVIGALIVAAMAVKKG
jgi:hypothetical protein